MTEDPIVPNMPEPASDEAAGKEPSQPTENAPQAETSPESAPQPHSSKHDESLSELRQALESQEKSARKSGGLFHRITGLLRGQPTAPLRGTGSAAAERGKKVEQPEGEVPDDLITGRLGGPAENAPLQETPASPAMPESWEGVSGETGDLEVPGLLQAQELPELDETLPQEYDALTFSSLAGQAEEEAEPDWMAEIRQEAAGEEAATDAFGERVRSSEETPPSAQPGEEPPAPHSGSGPLSFITGLLRGSEARRRREAGEEISDDIVSGRLDRSLGRTSKESEPAPDAPLTLEEFLAQEPPAAQPGQEEAESAFDFSQFMLEEDAGPGQAQDQVQNQFGLEELDSRFEQLGNEPPTLTTEPLPPLETQAPPELTPEDEKLLWGDTGALNPDATSEIPSFAPEDVWGGPETGTLRPAEPPATPPSLTSDEYASIFLTGEGLPPAPEAGFTQDNLLRDALVNAPEQQEDALSISAIRKIALEDYQEPVEGAPVQAVVEAAAPAAGEIAVPQAVPEKKPAFSLRRWYASLTPIQKFLAIEALVVAVVLLVLLPYYFYRVLPSRAPVAVAPEPTYLVPRPLAADLPFPIGLTLPGGWNFTVQKSNFVKGQWQPLTAEWLEGTELRRVIALPWNAQTEAVIHTFQPGDEVMINLSNGDKVTYKVSEVKRVPVSDTTIYNDSSPSLIVILYQEKATERWVVFSKP